SLRPPPGAPAPGPPTRHRRPCRAPAHPAAWSSPLRQRKLPSSVRRRSNSTNRSAKATAPPTPVSKYLVPPGENLVQRFGPERRSLRELDPDLLDVFLPALLDLVLEQLRQRAVAQPLLALLGMVHHQVGHERPREPAGLLFRVLHHERIHRPERARHALAGRRGRGGTRTAGGGGGGAAGMRGAAGAGAGGCGGAAAPAGAAGARWAAATAGAAAPAPAAPPPPGFTANTLLHTAQRARTPPAGTLAGSTRYTVSHDGQVTFISRAPRSHRAPGRGADRPRTPIPVASSHSSSFRSRARSPAPGARSGDADSSRSRSTAS